MRILSLLFLALLITGCPDKKVEPVPAAPEKVAAPAKAPAVEITGCYQWSEEGQEPHQLRLTGKDGVISGEYLGVEGPEFIAWFQVVPKDLKVEGDAVSFSLGERDLWGDAMGMDTDLSGKESAGFSRNLWVYSGKIEAKGFVFTCTAEGADEFCTVESGLFARVDAKVCGPVPAGF